MSNNNKHCLNCGTQLTDAYCPHCGQEASVGRLTIKKVIIDNLKNAYPEDKRFFTTAFNLTLRPWVVIRDYIHGRRVAYTQPVRFIVIMCFFSIALQILVPDKYVSETVAATGTIEESFWIHLWRQVQDFLRTSRVTEDMIDSVVLAPVMYLMYIPWGGKRFNLAEYSTAYLYLSGTGLVIDLLLFPITLASEFVSSLIEIIWWIYLMNGMTKHSLHFRNRYEMALVMMASVIVIASIDMLNRLIF